MPKSKASMDAEEQRQRDYMMLRQDVEENQSDLTALRAELSSVSAKQDQFHAALGSVKGSVDEINQQMVAMADVLKSLKPITATKKTNPETVELDEDLDEQHNSASLEFQQAMLMQKRAEVDALRRQLIIEQEVSRRVSQNVPNARRSAPPGFGHPNQSTQHNTREEDSQFNREFMGNPQPNPAWSRYTREYEQDMRNQFMKNITKGPRLNFPTFDGENPVEWIRQCEKCFQMSATPEEYKFSLAQLYIVGKADVWLRRSKILKTNPSWSRFYEMLMQRFSAQSSYQLVETFNNLRQQNLSVKAYADLFEELMATISEENPELSEGWFVRYFVNGLRDGIKYQLRPLRPSTLTEAFWLATDME